MAPGGGFLDYALVIPGWIGKPSIEDPEPESLHIQGAGQRKQDCQHKVTSHDKDRTEMTRSRVEDHQTGSQGIRGRESQKQPQGGLTQALPRPCAGLFRPALEPITSTAGGFSHRA
ncbi:hypothetical protein B0O99DRAFT_590061 [Bisporella sp. PMI_857]|nr:hypothetical protein B0O99DRAFT_590061 [Bisporella sp. PMI_857]